MKKLILLSLFLVSSCATHQRPGLIPKMLSYVSAPIKSQLEKSTPDKLQKIVETIGGISTISLS